MKKLILLVVAAGLTVTSCKKNLEEKFVESQKVANGNAVTVSKMSDIKVPAGFKWETSKDVQLKINSSDARFGSTIHKITVFSADPNKGGIKLAEGSVSNTKPFEALISTATNLKEYFVVKQAPDNSKVMEKIAITGTLVQATVTVNSSPIKLGKSVGPDCTTGCGTVVNNPTGNLTYSSGTICLTGTINISNLTMQNGVIIRVCGTGSINNLNMNGNSSSQFIITSSGNVNFTSTLPIDRNVIVYGTLSTSSNRNININSTGTFTNEGTVNVGKDFNPNGSSVIVNNGTIDVAEKLINSSGCDFTNNCKLIVHDDFQNNGLFKNYGYVKCYEESTIQGGSNNEF